MSIGAAGTFLGFWNWKGAAILVEQRGRRLQLLDHLDAGLRLLGLGGLGLEAVDEALEVRDLFERAFARLVVELHLHAARLFERIVAALVERELAALEMDDRGHGLVEQVAVVADHEDGVGRSRDISKPERPFEIEIVGRLVEQQQILAG